MDEAIITRAEALARGFTDEQIEARLVGGRWQRVFRGVYATFTGPLPRRMFLQAAVSWAGSGAALSHESAAELNGLLDEPAPLIHVTIPATRRLRAAPGIRVHHSSRISEAMHPTRQPRQTTIEETVLDLTATAPSLDQAVGWLTRACGRRLTTPTRLQRAFVRRSRMRWRAELTEAVGGIHAGCHSVLELRYLCDVERAHRLPTGERQAIRWRSGGRWYDDVHYPPYRIRVELDGRAAHPDEARWRDARRDNAAAAAGDTVLRYGWGDVTERSCHTAAQVARVLRRNGWTGRLRRCSDTCVIR